MHPLHWLAHASNNVLNIKPFLQIDCEFAATKRGGSALIQIHQKGRHRNQKEEGACECIHSLIFISDERFFLTFPIFKKKRFENTMSGVHRHKDHRRHGSSAPVPAVPRPFLSYHHQSGGLPTFVVNPHHGGVGSLSVQPRDPCEDLLLKPDQLPNGAVTHTINTLLVGDNLRKLQLSAARSSQTHVADIKNIAFRPKHVLDLLPSVPSLTEDAALLFPGLKPSCYPVLTIQLDAIFSLIIKTFKALLIHRILCAFKEMLLQVNGMDPTNLTDLVNFMQEEADLQSFQKLWKIIHVDQKSLQWMLSVKMELLKSLDIQIVGPQCTGGCFLEKAQVTARESIIKRFNPASHKEGIGMGSNACGEKLPDKAMRRNGVDICNQKFGWHLVSNRHLLWLKHCEINKLDPETNFAPWVVPMGAKNSRKVCCIVPCQHSPLFFIAFLTQTKQSQKQKVAADEDQVCVFVSFFVLFSLRIEHCSG